MKNLILTATLIHLLLAHSAQANTIPWERDFSSAQKKAQDTGKLLLIDFYHPK
jgi:hypothetical protein